MSIERPDLSNLPAEVRTYIQWLESELAERQSAAPRPSPAVTVTPPEPSEPETTINIVTISRAGRIKRTPRHFYTRQRRGGMGVFDLEISDDDYPISLAAVDENQRLLLLTNLARAFQLPLNKLPAGEIRSRGDLIQDRLDLHPDEYVRVILPNPGQGYITMVSERGYVRRLRNHVFGEYMKPGTAVLDLKETGELVAAGLTSGEGDVFIATRSGIGIRFAEKAVPPMGCLGIRLKDRDVPVAVCGVREHSGVFLLEADGRGTIRLMSGFAANKAPGAGGKITMKTDALVGAVNISETDDLFAISRQSKIIRFQAVEVPPKEGVVQGVICMSLRSDETTAVTSGS